MMRTTPTFLALACWTIVTVVGTALAAPPKKGAAAAAPSAPPPAAAVAAPQAAPPEQSSGFRIDQPGTITFTVGVKIVGKLEKPEVVIFLPKERPYYRPVQFRHSFAQDVLEPLPLDPSADMAVAAPRQPAEGKKGP